MKMLGKWLVQLAKAVFGAMLVVVVVISFGEPASATEPPPKTALVSKAQLVSEVSPDYPNVPHGIAIGAQQTMTLSAQLASIDAGTPVANDSLAAARIQFLLSSVSKKTKARQSKIADMAAEARGLSIKNYGKNVSIAQLLEIAHRSDVIDSTSALASYWAVAITLNGQ